MGGQICITIIEVSTEVSKKLKIKLSHNPGLGHIPKGLSVYYSDTYTSPFFTAVSTITGNWNQPSHLSTDNG